MSARGRGGAVVVAGRTVTASSLKASIKAKCEANQEAVDKLFEVQKNVAEKNPESRYIFVLKKAMKSVADCKTPVTCLADAVKLKGIGPKLAEVMFPRTPQLPSDAPPAPVETNGRAAKRPRKTESTTADSCMEQGPSKKQTAYEKAKKEAENLSLPVGPWRILLIIDGREPKAQHMISKCQQSGIPCEERPLPIGDMAWIAQCPVKGKGNVEIMCGTILERKEVNDLAQSLFGTRYLEQRMRLKASGLPQVLFLVEGDLRTTRNCPPETLEMAMMETRCQLGFQVVRTQHMQDTVRLLKGLHRRIVQRLYPDVFSSNETVLPSFGSLSPTSRRRRRNERRPTSLLEMVFDTPPAPPLDSERFVTYAELKAKIERDREAGTRTVQAISLAMIKQIPTFSTKKCHAIAAVYPTFNHLMTSLVTAKDPATLVKDVPCGRQTIGPKSSQEIYLAFCTRRDGSLPSEAPAKKLPATGAAAAPPISMRSDASPASAAVADATDAELIPKPNKKVSPAHRVGRNYSKVTESSPESSPAMSITSRLGSPEKSTAHQTVDLTQDTPVRKEPARKAQASRALTFQEEFSPESPEMRIWQSPDLSVASAPRRESSLSFPFHSPTASDLESSIAPSTIKKKARPRSPPRASQQPICLDSSSDEDSTCPNLKRATGKPKPSSSVVEVIEIDL